MSAAPRELLAAVEVRSGKLAGREVRFLCPAHDDHTPSADYHLDKETWVCRSCDAGGGWIDLCGRLGVPLPERQGPIEVAHYDYTNAAGALLFQVVRLEPKNFRQRRPAVGGGWEWNLDGVGRVLYRLPEVVAAVAAKRAVYLCEGEKDADRLVRLGLTATTNAGGAGKWRKEYSEALRGGRVVILPDNDPAGAEHGRKVAASLIGVAAKAVVVELPKLPAKGDVSDWLSHEDQRSLPAEDIRAELAHLANTVGIPGAVYARAGKGEREEPSPEAAPDTSPPRITIPDLLAHKFPPLPWLVEDLIPAAGLILCVAPPKSGKSALASGLAAAVAMGNDARYWERKTASARVLYIDLETGDRFAQDRWERVLHNQPKPEQLVTSFVWPRLGEGCMRELGKELDAHPDTRLIVVDVLSLVWPVDGGRGGQNAYHRENAILERLRTFAKEREAALLLLHHPKKSEPHATSGTSAMDGAPDVLLRLEREIGAAVGQLHVTGRIVRDQRIDLTWDNLFGTWYVQREPHHGDRGDHGGMHIVR